MRTGRYTHRSFARALRRYDRYHAGRHDRWWRAATLPRATIANAAPILRDIFAPDRVAQTLYRGSPLLALIAKDERAAS